MMTKKGLQLFLDVRTIAQKILTEDLSALLINEVRELAVALEVFHKIIRKWQRFKESS